MLSAYRKSLHQFTQQSGPSENPSKRRDLRGPTCSTWAAKPTSTSPWPWVVSISGLGSHVRMSEYIRPRMQNMDAEALATARRPLKCRLVESRPFFRRPAASRGVCSWRLGSQLAKSTCPSESYGDWILNHSEECKWFLTAKKHITSRHHGFVQELSPIQRLNIFQPFSATRASKPQPPRLSTLVS